ncbi:YIP1 family protein [Pleionea litopenaei]|uniref:YIP1 family protein n=1 Tax=Pleionea litopenaei TaxID=3070815 RepID=A0AA51X7T0_9GAMM|nr:YIP1 family protein [Pleionea sp. HL-JVS1]WMS88553.1 YIP1 family protein [Pleionea sp. HL-JVS1]
MSEQSGLLKTTLNLITSPSEAFADLRVHGRAWFPLILIILSAVVSWVYYYQVVDFSWSIEQTISTQDMSKLQKEEALKMYESMGANTMLGITVGSTIVMVPIIFAIYSLYLLIVSNIRNDDLRFGQCFTLSCWSSLVAVFSSLVSILQILFSSTNQIPQSALKGLNINDLILSLEPGNAWYTFATSFDLTSIWGSILMAIGYKAFTKCGTGTAYVIGFLPFGLIYGIWALVIVV